MSFLGWFTGKLLGIAPAPAPAPAPVHVTPAPVPEAAPVALVVRIDHYNKSLRRWMLVDTPFASSSELSAKKLSGSYLFAKVRITVLEGGLTITGTGVSGKHSPKITKFPRNHVLTAGQAVIVECSLGPSEGGSSGHHEQVNWGVHTKELGEVVKLAAVVSFG